MAKPAPTTMPPHITTIITIMTITTSEDPFII